jgi:hypothetical protein
VKTCQAVRPPNLEPCGKPATYVVTFQDKDTAYTCADCVLYLGQLAGSHGASLRAEKLAP